MPNIDLSICPEPLLGQALPKRLGSLFAYSKESPFGAGSGLETALFSRAVLQVTADTLVYQQTKKCLRRFGIKLQLATRHIPQALADLVGDIPRTGTQIEVKLSSSSSFLKGKWNNKNKPPTVT